MSTIIRPVAVRELADQQRAEGQGTQAVVLRVIALNRGKVIRNVSCALNKGELPRFPAVMRAGRTEVARAIFGAFIMSLLMNGLGVMGVRETWKIVVPGVIIIVVDYIDIVLGKNTNQGPPPLDSATTDFDLTIQPKSGVIRMKGQFAVGAYPRRRHCVRRSVVRRRSVLPDHREGLQRRCRQSVKTRAEGAAARNGIKMTFEGPKTEREIDEQTAILNAAIKENPQGPGFAAPDP